MDAVPLGAQADDRRSELDWKLGELPSARGATHGKSITN
jgi:hypothetical protein